MSDPSLPPATTDDYRDMTFEDPKAGRKRAYRPRIAAGGKKLSTKSTASPEDRLTVDRYDAAALAEIEANPTEFLRKRYQIMLSKEQQIIDSLYNQDPPDDKALTAALKRITDIGDSLKALPKQSNETAANQKSLAEIIQDAIDRYLVNPATSVSAFQLGTIMLERSKDAFGEGA